ncbi:MAG: MBL fold metallo-hydrolase [Planctomycetota bacterium]
MNDIARVTVLVDNRVQGTDLLAEHGLAFWVEIRGRHLLVDTGQGMVLSHNAQHMGIPLDRLDTVVLSHGHYDHTGGLHQVLQAAPQARVYAHPAVLGGKYGRKDDGTSRDIGMPSPSSEVLRERGEALTWTEGSTEVGGGVFATGEIPRHTDYEDTGGPFFTDRECRQADAILDDQAVFFESRLGSVVLLGCSHAGVINTLRYVQELTGAKPIHTVIGGMHLVTATRDRMDRTIEDLRRLDVQRLGPAHCTGAAAEAELWNALPGRCFSCGVGLQMDFEIP